MMDVKFHSVDVESPAYANVCDLCGSVVSSKKTHESWHRMVGF